MNVAVDGGFVGTLGVSEPFVVSWKGFMKFEIDVAILRSSDVDRVVVLLVLSDGRCFASFHGNGPSRSLTDAFNA